MKALKVIVLLLGTGLLLAVWSDPVVVVKVLQNGLDSYQGCDDALVFYKDGVPTVNFGTHDSLKVYWATA